MANESENERSLVNAESPSPQSRLAHSLRRLTSEDVLAPALIGLVLGLIEYLVLILFLDDREIFWRSLTPALATVAATQIWIDALRFRSSGSHVAIMAPALGLAIFALVIGFSVVGADRGNFESEAYYWTIAALFVAGASRMWLTEQSEGR